MKNLESVREEKVKLLNSVISEIEAREKTISQANKEKQSLETQGLVIQGAIAMIDELLAESNEKVEAEIVSK